MIWLEKDFNKLKEYYNQTYFNQEISERIKNRVHQRIKSKKMSLGKKIAYFSSAAIAAVGLFIGLSFFSPSIANVAAKIPYLNMIFESKPINEEVWDELTERGYPISGFGMSYRPKKIATVSLDGNEEYVNDVEPEVKKIVKGLLLAKNYDAYDIHVEKARYEKVEMTAKEKKEMEEYDQIAETIIEVLKKYGYENAGGFGADIANKSVDINLPNTEAKVEEIKKDIQAGLTAKGLGTYSFKVHLYDAKKREREGRWMPIINTIAEGIFGSKEFKVKGVGYSNKSATHMTITIKTTVPFSDPDSQKVIKKIESTILEFLNSEKTKKIIENDPYKIIIYTKDKKEHVIISE